MRAYLLLTALGLPAMVAASAPAPPNSPTLDQALASARSDAASADAEVKRLDQAAAAARGTAQRLHAQQLSAAQAIAAAEARITAADAEIRLIAARQGRLQAQLSLQQQPIATLLGGLAQMADRPPLLVMASGDNAADELVHLRILIETTTPVIRTRTQALRAQLSASAKYQQAAATARAHLRQGKSELAAKRERFASLEAQALAAASSTDVQALQAGDAALSASETADRLGAEAAGAGIASTIAAELSREPPPPSGPQIRAAAPLLPFPYTLPANAPVRIGLGAVSASGVRSRGIQLATGRGSTIVAPAAGTIRFAGPFRNYDGVVIIDHGGGWLSLIVNVATTSKAGSRVELGAPLGRALGSIDVELSRNGRRFSPALIAGSSRPLSKGAPNG